MSAPAARIRLLLLALGLTAVVGLLYWPEVEEGSWAPNPNHLRDHSASTLAVPVPALGAQHDTPPSATLSDSAYMSRVAQYGMLLLERRDGADTGSFYFVELNDSTRTLRSLGFIRAASLLDSTARFAALGEFNSLPPLAVAPSARVDSAFRRIDDCVTEIAVPLRGIAAGAEPWTLALMPGAALALPTKEEWRSDTSAADRVEALRLARTLPPDSTQTNDGPLLDSTRAAQPPELRSLHRFTRGGVEFLIADIRMEYRKHPERADGSDRVYEQRLVVAERDVSDRSTLFHIAWSHQDAAGDDEPATEEPVMMLLLGDDRLLTLYTNAHYKDGGGGVFLSRFGNGRWRRVASWTSGC